MKYIFFLGIAILWSCGGASEPLKDQDIRMIQSVIEENQKIQEFLIQTENGMPSLQGLESSIFTLESSTHPKLSKLAQKMKIKIQAIHGKDKESDFQNFSDFSEILVELTKEMESSGVYKFYCPMVKKTWVSKGKAVHNPYAPEMRECGDLIIN
jgi:hypothetical protein